MNFLMFKGNFSQRKRQRFYLFEAKLSALFTLRFPRFLSLEVFFSNLKSSTTVDKKLVEKARRFQRHLTKRFNWDFETEPDEFAPVVVET